MTEAREAAQDHMAGALESAGSRTDLLTRPVRNEVRAYADGHDRPLDSYLMITCAYWAVVAGMASGERVPPAQRRARGIRSGYGALTQPAPVARHIAAATSFRSTTAT